MTDNIIARPKRSNDGHQSPVFAHYPTKPQTRVSGRGAIMYLPSISQLHRGGALPEYTDIANVRCCAEPLYSAPVSVGGRAAAGAHLRANTGRGHSPAAHTATHAPNGGCHLSDQSGPPRRPGAVLSVASEIPVPQRRAGLRRWRPQYPVRRKAALAVTGPAARWLCAGYHTNRRSPPPLHLTAARRRPAVEPRAPRVGHRSHHTSHGHISGAPASVPRTPHHTSHGHISGAPASVPRAPHHTDPRERRPRYRQPGAAARARARSAPSARNNQLTKIRRNNQLRQTVKGRRRGLGGGSPHRI